MYTPDLDCNTSQASNPVTITIDGETSAPVITNSSGGITNPSPTILGTAEKLSSVEISRIGGVLLELPVDGNWSLAKPIDLIDWRSFFYGKGNR